LTDTEIVQLFFVFSIHHFAMENWKAGLHRKPKLMQTYSRTAILV